MLVTELIAFSQDGQATLMLMTKLDCLLYDGEGLMMLVATP